MSISGVIMQQMTQNKFVSPTTAGTLEAAKIGLLIFLIFTPRAGITHKMVAAFLFTFLASMVFLAIVRKIRHRNVIFVPLVGLMFGGIIGSISTFFAVQLNIVQDTNAWMMGDFSGILQGRYELIYLSLPAILITYLYANKFTLIGMGEDFSRNLGLNYNAIMHIGLFCVSLTVSSVVITAGAIPFLGLIVPNVVSLLFGDNLKKTLPLVALSGAIFLLVCDIIGRVVIFPYEIPIGVTVSIIGSILFLFMLLWRKK
jgi:iron complex transport system permease protein